MPEENQKIRVVYVDDDWEIIEMMKHFLTNEGYEVVGAVGGEKGYETVLREKPDVVLLDLMMPEVDGWKVYSQIKSHHRLKDIPIIIVTALDSSSSKAFALRFAKVDDYITKPYSPKDLVKRLRKVLVRCYGTGITQRIDGQKGAQQGLPPDE